MQFMSEQSTDLCQHLLDNLNTAVLLLDAELTVRYINPAGEMLFALSAQRTIGKPLAKLLQRGEDLLAELTDGLATGHPFTRREVLLHWPDHEATVDYTAIPLMEAQGPRSLLLELTQVDRHLRISRDEQLIAQQEATREEGRVGAEADGVEE